MQQSTKRILSLLLTGVFFVAALVIYANLIRPEYKETQKLRGSLIAKTNLFDEQKQIISQVQNLLAQYQGAAKLQEVVSLALPLDESVSTLFQQIFTISQFNRVAIQSFALRTLAIQPTGLGTVQMELKLSGSYESVKAFLQMLETNVRVMDVSQLAAQSADPLKRKDLLSFNTIINAYYQQ